jgi:hypothetical protein
VPILESLRIAAQVVVNVPMREAVEEASLRIREGAMISRSLAASRLFPPMTTHLISSGEASGRLEEMLDRAATNQEREVDSLVATLLGIQALEISGFEHFKKVSMVRLRDPEFRGIQQNIAFLGSHLFQA